VVVRGNEIDRVRMYGYPAGNGFTLSAEIDGKDGLFSTIEAGAQFATINQPQKSQ
jgi:hypothetical protein